MCSSLMIDMETDSSGCAQHAILSLFCITSSWIVNISRQKTVAFLLLFYQLWQKTIRKMSSAVFVCVLLCVLVCVLVPSCSHPILLEMDSMFHVCVIVYWMLCLFCHFCHYFLSGSCFFTSILCNYVILFFNLLFDWYSWYWSVKYYFQLSVQ